MVICERQLPSCIQCMYGWLLPRKLSHNLASLSPLYILHTAVAAANSMWKLDAMHLKVLM
jgi:hypothetical protein